MIDDSLDAQGWDETAQLNLLLEVREWGDAKRFKKLKELEDKKNAAK